MGSELTEEQAYTAMYLYLEKLNRLINSNDLSGLLGSMSLMPDGKPADPAVWGDWLEAVADARSPDTDINLNLNKR